MLGLLVELIDRYEIKSNRESGFGRYDVMLRPRNVEKDKAIIMEFKEISPKKEKSLEETAQNALKQIKERYKIMEQQQPEKKHKRRVRYKGTHPRRFEEKYKQLGLNATLLENQKKQRNSLDVVDFPLMLRDNETSQNLGTYVQEWMEVLPENLVKFCAFVGLYLSILTLE